MKKNSDQDPRVRVWNRLRTTPPSVFVQSIRVTQSDAFEPQEIRLSPATCIVGSHGTGKTVLLRALEAAFGYSGQEPPFVGDPGYSRQGIEPVTGIFEVGISSGSALSTRTVNLADSPQSRAEVWTEGVTSTHEVAFVSSARVASDWGFLFQDISSAKKYAEEGAKRQYRPVELSAIRNILGKSYESAHVQTIPLDDHLHVAYVTIKINGATIDSTKLSLGEFWVHQVFWELDQLAPGSLFLLDEPESFLSVRGHRPFIDEVARRCLERDLQLVVATHSPELLSRFAMQDIRMCMRGSSGKIRVVQPERLTQIHMNVGIEIPIKTLVLVEDAFAVDVLRAILGQLNVPLGAIEIAAAGGKDPVKAGVRALASVRGIRCLGVLDADQKGQVKDESNILTLPGSDEPEHELLKAAHAQLNAVASLLGRSPEALLLAVNDCEFLDHQYQPARLAQSLGLDEGFVLTALVRAWLQNSSIGDEARRLASKIGDE